MSVLINLYQPSVSDEDTFRKVVNDRYLPLIKLIKEKSNIKILICIPLCTLELLDNFGYGKFILDLKSLCEADKVQLTGTTAYNSQITDLSKEMLQKQIILNEYGMGYYLGAKQGFEGEPSIMIKDLDAFFPPEFKTNKSATSLVESLGYKEVLSEENPLFYIDLGTESFGIVEDLIEESVFEEKSKSVTKYDKGTLIGKKFSEIEELLVKSFMSNDEVANINDFETLAFWKDSDLSLIEDTSVHNKIRSFVSFSKLLGAEKYKISIEKNILEKYTDLVSEVLKYLGDEKTTSEVTPILEELEKLLI